MSQPPERILLIRLSALGDVVMASGLIPALRHVHPAAHLAWLTEPPAAPLLAHNPRLDEVIVWPRAQWQRLWRERRYGALWREMRQFRRALKARRFDVAIDAQGLLKSGLWSWLSGAPRRVSLIGREGSRYLATELVMPPMGEDERIGSEYRHLARRLGAPEEAFRLDLAIGEAPREAARRRLGEAGVTGPFVAICPFTTRPQKHWFEDRWGELAAGLRGLGLVPVMLGGPADADAARRIAAQQPAVVDLAGRLRLDESAAVIAGSRLLIGVDTGLTHMGSALGVPTIALFGSTRPYLDAASPRTRVLYDALECSPCRRHPTCGGAYDCMRQFTVQRVLAEARAALERA